MKMGRNKCVIVVVAAGAAAATHFVFFTTYPCANL